MNKFFILVLAHVTISNRLWLWIFKIHSLLIPVLILIAVILEVWGIRKHLTSVKLTVVAISSIFVIALVYATDKYVEEWILKHIGTTLQIIDPKEGRKIKGETVNIEVYCLNVKLPVSCIVENTELWCQGSKVPQSFALEDCLDFECQLGSGNIGVDKKFKIFTIASGKILSKGPIKPEEIPMDALYSNTINVFRIK